MAYAERALADNVVHAEIFFAPQTHMERGVSLETLLAGLEKGLLIADERGLSSRLIMCFLRHLPEEEAITIPNASLPYFDRYAHRLIGVGMDSTEIGIRPSTFARVFEQARSAGIAVVALAGEEGPAEYVCEALDALKVARIDHGVASITDPMLVERLARERIPLTVCPLSNLRLNVVDDMSKHPLLTLLEKGVMVTFNSDDPAYFGGYINANFASVIESLNLSDQQVYTLPRNSLVASFLPDTIAKKLLDQFWFAEEA
ncbi:Adenine deaminase [Pseudomonas coronafaciens pv. zizaniae]|nr:Adenine deaminase [Pseudomonas coronafaciens pv. zizaniae]